MKGELNDQPFELPWGKRPVSARDIVNMDSVIVLVCIGTAILTIYCEACHPSHEAVAPASDHFMDAEEIEIQCDACHDLIGIVRRPGRKS